MDTEKQSGTGYLRVQVSSANGAFPEAGATVTVFSDSPEGGRMIRSTVTDVSGQTEILPLPAVSKEYSEVPGNFKPYTTYNILVSKTGFYPVENVASPVFDGIVSLQRVNLIPRGEFPNVTGNDGITVIETPPYYGENDSVGGGGDANDE